MCTYCRAGFLYGFYFCKLTCLRKLNPNENVFVILYCMRTYCTTWKLNPKVNLKHEIINLSKISLPTVCTDSWYIYIHIDATCYMLHGECAGTCSEWGREWPNCVDEEDDWRELWNTLGDLTETPVEWEQSHIWHNHTHTRMHAHTHTHTHTYTHTRMHIHTHTHTHP